MSKNTCKITEKNGLKILTIPGDSVMGLEEDVTLPVEWRPKGSGSFERLMKTELPPRKPREKSIVKQLSCPKCGRYEEHISREPGTEIECGNCGFKYKKITLK
jgi:hypothetical protein